MLVINAIVKNFKVILVALVFVLMGLYIQQCKNTAEYKSKYNTAVTIAEGNLAAIKDSSIQLKMTRDQLRTLDSNLYNLVQKNDSLLKVKSQVVTVTKPVYVPVDVKFVNHLKYDTCNDRYGLAFNASDSVRTFDGTSWFKLSRTNNNIDINPDSTDINNFKFNFAMVVSQYKDETTKFTKAKITPYYIDSLGRTTNPISDKLLKFDVRNIEILDKPYTEVNPNEPPKQSKYKVVTGWGLSFSPLGVGFVTDKGVIMAKYAPNISLSYCILLKKR